MMKTFLLAATAFATSQALTTDSFSVLNTSQHQAWTSFVDYALDFKKKYRFHDNQDELVQFRFKAFSKNLDRIKSHNEAFKRGVHSFTLGLNDRADLTDAEYKQLLSYRSSGSMSSGATEMFSKVNNFNDIPNSYDWRTKGIVTRVKDQGECESCWAFSAVAAMESAYALKTGRLETFSEQELVDCTLGGIQNCKYGGEISKGYEEIINHHGGKILREVDYKYTAESKGVCNAKDDKAVGHFTAYVNVMSGNETALQAAVATNGVQAVAIDSSSPTFLLYESGVYNWPSCGNKLDALDHGVAVVGFGTYKKTDSWLVKNSWGESWGMKGYAMMIRNKANQCGIATAASYPIMKE